MRETPRDLHLCRDGTHDIGTREKRDLVDGIRVRRIGHRDREVVVVVERDRNHAQLDRHVLRDGGDDTDR
jgi:hypothetical protein